MVLESLVQSTNWCSWDGNSQRSVLALILGFRLGDVGPLGETWWVLLFHIPYSVLYATTSDSRWHEAGHGTAFKTDWMNSSLYEIASFMVMREATV